MSMRGMSAKEKNIAYWQVFRNTLPYNKIMISGAVGVSNRPYTTPDIGMPGRYIIHIGNENFWSSKSPGEYFATLIHELTHVWQGYNSWFSWGYTLKSVWAQAHKGAGAYRYEPFNGVEWRSWNEYNVEQQAQIVEDWFKNGSNDRDPRWRYIRDNIRNP